MRIPRLVVRNDDANRFAVHAHLPRFIRLTAARSPGRVKISLIDDPAQRIALKRRPPRLLFRRFIRLVRLRARFGAAPAWQGSSPSPACSIACSSA